jgi:beta-glucosidase
MPGPTRWRGSALNHAIASNKISTAALDNCVREVLKLVQRASKAGVPEHAPETELNREEDRKLLRKAASDALVLLKNEGHVLPLKKTQRIAVIGPNSKIAAYSGGGSATLKPYEAVTPFDGIVESASAGVDFAQGVYGHQLLPVIGKQLRTEDGQVGFSLKFFNDPPEAPNRELLEARNETDFSPFFLDYKHPNLRPVWYADAEGYFTPEESGTYDFGLCVRGTGKLYVDGKLLINNADKQKPGSSFLGTGTVEEKGSLELVAGQTHRILVEWASEKTSKVNVPGTVYFGHGGFRLGAAKRISPEEGIETAVKLASNVDQVVLFAGLSSEWESEGEDRLSMKLPPYSDKLISRVLDANPNTVVVIQSGTPVEMPWIAKAKSVVQAWYGGNECGRAIADIIYGDTNPVS